MIQLKITISGGKTNTDITNTKQPYVILIRPMLIMTKSMVTTPGGKINTDTTNTNQTYSIILNNRITNKIHSRPQ